jgi:hypothetical protein
MVDIMVDIMLDTGAMQDLYLHWAKVRGSQSSADMTVPANPLDLPHSEVSVVSVGDLSHDAQLLFLTFCLASSCIAAHFISICSFRY